MTLEIPRALFLPPPGRPKWVSADDAELNLSYLSWGSRRYDRSPIQMSRHSGWTYFCLLKGSAIFRFEASQRNIRGATCLVIHPECACAIHGTSPQASEILTWVWHGPPQFSPLEPAAGGHLAFPLAETTVRQLRLLHIECRREVKATDEFTKAALSALRLRVDLVIARKRPARSVDQAVQIELGLEWMQQNLASHQPIAGLCVYLGISSPTLFRAFRHRLGQSPRSCFQRLRLERARQLLAAGRMVKETAAILGYAYPNDLSRALRDRAAYRFRSK